MKEVAIEDDVQEQKSEKTVDFNSSTLQGAVKIVEAQHYIAFPALCRALEIGEKAIQNDFLIALQEECAHGNPRIGEVDEEERCSALLQPNVSIFYSKNWEKAIPWPTVVGKKIGYDLYRRILSNNWNNFGAGRGVNFRDLETSNLDQIIKMQMGFTGFRYAWEDFSKMYREYDLQVLLEKYRQLIRDWHKAMIDLTELNNQQVKESFKPKWQKQKNNCVELLKGVIDQLSRMEEQGFILASYQLGVLCEKKNNDKAQKYYEKASRDIENFLDQENGEAEFCLAEMYYYGRGRGQDSQQATYWCQRAQELGNSAASEMLHGMKLNSLNLN